VSPAGIRYTAAMAHTTDRRQVLRSLGAAALLGACARVLPDEPNASSLDSSTADGSATQADAPLDAGPTTDIATSDTAATDTAAPGTSAPDVTVADVPKSSGPIPAITSNDDHYVTSCCPTPKVDGKAWQLEVSAFGKALGTLDLAFLSSLVPKTKEHTLECISAGPLNFAISNAIWTGLPILEVLAAKGLTLPEGKGGIKFTCADGYTTAIPQADLAKPAWLVWQMNGQPLPIDHGYPVRLLLPGRYGMKNPKWITSLEVIDEPYLGFWEKLGWSDAAPYKPNALVFQPEDDDKLPLGKQVVVAGPAFAGSDPVTKVELRVNDGPWQPCAIDYAPGPDVWTLWHFDWTPPKAGTYLLQVRCQTASGQTSQDNAKRYSDYTGFGGGMAVEVKVG
jgi:DMSO/TMAO reductase YedYZ molybdopterin-dependent catalytic subunit